jgi:hypothetical protein
VGNVKFMDLLHAMLCGLVAGNQHFQMDLILNLYTAIYS